MIDLRCAYSEELRVAVTGATGFVGRGIISASDNPFRRERFENIPGNSVVIHCAANVGASAAALKANLELDDHVMSAVNDRHAGVVYASTNNALPLGLDFGPDVPPSFRDYYGASKAFGEMLVRHLCKKPHAIARIGDVFGVGQRHGNLFKAIEASLRERKPLRLFGSGLKLRSYIYNPELSRILLFLASEIAGGTSLPATINVCYPDPMTVRDILSVLADQSGLEIEHVPLASDASERDIRTMISGPFGRYAPKWPTLASALSDYANSAARSQP